LYDEYEVEVAGRMTILRAEWYVNGRSHKLALKIATRFLKVSKVHMDKDHVSTTKNNLQNKKSTLKPEPHLWRAFHQNKQE
jgi:hypothetical protein